MGEHAGGPGREPLRLTSTAPRGKRGEDCRGDTEAAPGEGSVEGAGGAGEDAPGKAGWNEKLR